MLLFSIRILIQTQYRSIRCHRRCTEVNTHFAPSPLNSRQPRLTLPPCLLQIPGQREKHGGRSAHLLRRTSPSPTDPCLLHRAESSQPPQCQSRPSFSSLELRRVQKLTYPLAQVPKLIPRIRYCRRCFLGLRSLRQFIDPKSCRARARRGSEAWRGQALDWERSTCWSGRTGVGYGRQCIKEGFVSDPRGESHCFGRPASGDGIVADGCARLSRK